MKKSILVGLLLLLQGIAEAQTIDITYQDNHIYLPCQVNGKDAGLKVKKTKIIFGEVAVAVGGKTYTPQYVPLINLRPILGADADGLFGLKEIGDKVICIDVQDGKMSFADRVTADMTDGFTRIPIEYASGRVLIPFTVMVGEGQTISGKALMDMGSGQGLEFTSKTAAKYHLEQIEDKIPFHYAHGGIGGESSGYEFTVTTSLKLGDVEIVKLWSQFFVVLDLKNKSLYLKKIQ